VRSNFSQSFRLSQGRNGGVNAEPRAVASGCKHPMLSPPERSIHDRSVRSLPSQGRDGGLKQNRER